MKFGKWTTGIAALALCGLSATAQAAKVFTVTGTITPDQYGFGHIAFRNPAMSGDTRFTWGLTAHFSQPVSGSMGANGECGYCWFVLDWKTRNVLDANDGGVSMQYDFSNTKFAQTRARVQPSPPFPGYGVVSGGQTTYHTAIYAQAASNPIMELGLTNLTTPVQFTMSGFNSVPEPATWALLIFGFGGVGTAMRRKRPKSLSVT